MSFSALRDIFIGRLDADYCVKSLLSLKSSNNAKEYLVTVHRNTFPSGDTSKDERWRVYPSLPGRQSVMPIHEKDLSSSKFMDMQSNKLSFDISRFVEFLMGYTKVDDDIKPIMLHYGMIYLFDFFSRTWLKYGQNWGHGMKLTSKADEHSVKVQKSGIFPRAVDAFYLVYQSSIFSLDEDIGVVVQQNFEGGAVFGEIEKKKYSECPEISLTDLINVYENLDERASYEQVSESNPILVGYVVLFVMSSISRYNAKDWLKIREDRNLKNRLDLLQYDFLYRWTPEILMQTVLRHEI